MHARDFFPTSRGFRETLTVHPVGCQCAEWCATVAEPVCPTTGDALVSECDCGDFHACPAHRAVPAHIEPPCCWGESPDCHVVILGGEATGREWCETHKGMVD